MENSTENVQSKDLSLEHFSGYFLTARFRSGTFLSDAKKTYQKVSSRKIGIFSHLNLTKFTHSNENHLNDTSKVNKIFTH